MVTQLYSIMNKWAHHLIVVTIIFRVQLEVEGAEECRSSTLMCYDCDSRHDPYCGDPFNMTLPPELRPATKMCTGCCIKITHKFPHASWIQRTCTENIIINYFIVDHICLIEGKRRGKMCFCEQDYCNSAPSPWPLPPSILLLTFLIMFTNW